jgi:hypothetical protein
MSIDERCRLRATKTVMSAPDDVSRRTLLVAPAVLAFAGTPACAQEGGSTKMTGSRTLVAYLTRSGNTRVIAETLQRKLAATLFEIRPARAYPADYEQHVAQSANEKPASNLRWQRGSRISRHMTRFSSGCRSGEPPRQRRSVRFSKHMTWPTKGFARSSPMAAMVLGMQWTSSPATRPDPA